LKQSINQTRSREQEEKGKKRKSEIRKSESTRKKTNQPTNQLGSTIIEVEEGPCLL
jgi:hypothetical protein